MVELECEDDDFCAGRKITRETREKPSEQGEEEQPGRAQPH